MNPVHWPDELPGVLVQRAVDAQAFLALEGLGRDGIHAWQAARLDDLVQWLHQNVPWWRERLGATTGLNDWQRLPILSRFALAQHLARFGAAPVPPHHGALTPYQAGGAHGGSVRYYLSAYAQRLIDHACHADHVRQGRNPFAAQAWITDDVPAHDGEHVALAPSLEQGSGVQWLRSHGLFTKVQHVQWLARLQPRYLTVRPDWFEVALVHARAESAALPRLDQIITYGASVTDSLRNKARKWLGASVRHRYAYPACGPLAFQCPHSDHHLHVAVGNALLEVVDTQGQPAASGTIGRVLVTALHQYATPLLRVDVGDTAALHEHCPGCGVPVPTLSGLRQSV